MLFHWDIPHRATTTVTVSSDAIAPFQTPFETPSEQLQTEVLREVEGAKPAHATAPQGTQVSIDVSGISSEGSD
jgi:hypothetical protein